MNRAGNIYGVALNDREQVEALASSFSDKPYGAPPQAPVVYMKPGVCADGGPVRLPQGTTLVASPTLALLFARDTARVSEADGWDHVGAVCLALDLALPQKDYYRPAVAQLNGPGFLPLGEFVAPFMPDEIRTHIDEQLVHSWRLNRLMRPMGKLIADLSAFMTLRAGDLLLVGVPGDAPMLRAGQEVRVAAKGLPDLRREIQEIQP